MITKLLIGDSIPEFITPGGRLTARREVYLFFLLFFLSFLSFVFPF